MIIFAVLGVVLVGAWIAMRRQACDYEAPGTNDDLTIEQFRRIEFGDDEGPDPPLPDQPPLTVWKARASAHAAFHL